MSQAAVEKQEQKILDKAAQAELVKEVYKQEGLKSAPLKENRKLALSVLAIVVALSLLLIGPMKLNARYNRVISEFKSGSESNYTESVYNYIIKAADYASEMDGKMEAGKVSQEKIDELRQLVSDIKSEKDEKTLIQLYNRLMPTVQTVYDEYKANKGEGWDGAVYRSYDAINTTQTQINNMPYWQDAAAYNNARGGFPASLIGGLFGIDYVPDKSGH